MPALLCLIWKKEPKLLESRDRRDRNHDKFDIEDYPPIADAREPNVERKA